MKFLKSFAVVTTLIPGVLFAQDRPAAIVVMDASGSMWGQIDGVAKITIAQKVMGDLMTSLPNDLDLGLTVYGHRRKGDCSDIETLVMPGPDTRGAISDAVNAIKPKGKTPMADAVVAAAQALRHTEAAATVILVSDGIETCVPDVCAVARSLEETGVDFTAHVVGFDVTDPKARAQFQCMADATGGKYLSAANADELGEAVAQVAAAPQPAPPEPESAPSETRFLVVEGPDQKISSYDVSVAISGDNGVAHPSTDASDFKMLLDPGSYTAIANRPKDNVSVQQDFKVSSGVQTEVKLHLPAYAPLATLIAPDQAPAGSTIDVTWTGPNEENDYVDTALPDEGPADYQTYEYVAKGNPVKLRMPTTPGDYQIRYLLSVGPQVLASRPITVTERSFGLTGPATAPVGATINVEWAGSGYSEDYITLAPIGDSASDYVTYEYVSKGNPVPLRLTMYPGDFELRYINGQDSSIAASQTITLTDIAVTLTAPDTVPVKETVSVAFDGPAYKSDFITFVEPGADPTAFKGYAYTLKGNPAQIPAPDTPGTYELRFVSTWGVPRIMATKTVVVE
ncbi:VWA domain-containing protein [Shimia sp.]|uniref:vWA domain-containing protein n=1 Tax=Shimia sp. TaxID=1954381 RepID=UPI0032988B58